MRLAAANPDAHGWNQTAQTLSEAATVPQPQIKPTQFTMGSTPSEVAAVMGTPTSVRDFITEKIWSYGPSTVTFKNGGVSEWSNTAGNLRVVYPGAAPAYVQPKLSQTPAPYTQPAVAGSASSHSQITQPNARPTTTLNTGLAVAGNVSSRIGAICNDGWRSHATGSGACSHHGGVSCWLYSDGSCR